MDSELDEGSDITRRKQAVQLALSKDKRIWQNTFILIRKKSESTSSIFNHYPCSIALLGVTMPQYRNHLSFSTENN